MDRYTYLEKAAIVLLSLGEQLAAQLIRNMPEAEAKKILSAMSSISSVEDSELVEILDEFNQILNEKKPKTLRGSVEYTQKVLNKAFGTSAFASEFSHTLASSYHELTALKQVENIDSFMKLLESEHPQTLALILAHADAAMGAQMLKALEAEQRVEVTRRIAELESVDSQILRELDEHLLQLAEKTKYKGKTKGGSRHVAKLLAGLSEESEPILAQLENTHPELAEEIRGHMFTFEDLQKLTDASMRSLFQSLPKDTWSLALRMCSTSLMKKIKSNLSERASQMLEDDIAALGAQRKQDVIDAQNKITKKARELIDQAKLELMDDEPMV